MTFVMPPRGNAAHDCRPLPNRQQDPDLPDHIVECECPSHTGFCLECNYKITIGPSLTEYGHARKRNRDTNQRDEGDCPHRPTEDVDPQRGRAQRAAVHPAAIWAFGVVVATLLLLAYAIVGVGA